MDTLKPFDLEAARRGEPICTRDGREASFVGISKRDTFPLIVDIKGTDWFPQFFTIDGMAHDQTATCHTSDRDLFMAPKKRKLLIHLYRTDSGHQTLIHDGSYHPPLWTLLKTLEVEIEE